VRISLRCSGAAALSACVDAAGSFPAAPEKDFQYMTTNPTTTSTTRPTPVPTMAPIKFMPSLPAAAAAAAAAGDAVAELLGRMVTSSGEAVRVEVPVAVAVAGAVPTSAADVVEVGEKLHCDVGVSSCDEPHVRVERAESVAGAVPDGVPVAAGEAVRERGAEGVALGDPVPEGHAVEDGVRHALPVMVGENVGEGDAVAVKGAVSDADEVGEARGAETQCVAEMDEDGELEPPPADAVRLTAADPELVEEKELVRLPEGDAPPEPDAPGGAVDTGHRVGVGEDAGEGVSPPRPPGEPVGVKEVDGDALTLGDAGADAEMDAHAERERDACDEAEGGPTDTHWVEDEDTVAHGEFDAEALREAPLRKMDAVAESKAGMEGVAELRIEADTDMEGSGVCVAGTRRFSVCPWLVLWSHPIAPGGSGFWQPLSSTYSTCVLGSKKVPTGLTKPAATPSPAALRDTPVPPVLGQPPARVVTRCEPVVTLAMNPKRTEPHVEDVK